MAMNLPYRRLPPTPPPAPAPAPAFEQILGTRDCDPAIAELVLSADVARLFAPGGGDGPFDYNPTLKLSDGRQVVVRVHRAATGREALLGEAHVWRYILLDFYLMPGDLARFEKSLQENDTYSVLFQDPDGLNRLSRFEIGDDDPPSPTHFVPVDFLQPRAAELSPRQVEQAARNAAACAWRLRTLQGGDMTVKEAMDLAVECGAGEGSDEHYMATKLFVKAENRAMFLTFRTNAGRLQWLRRCYEDQNRMMN